MWHSYKLYLGSLLTCVLIQLIVVDIAMSQVQQGMAGNYNGSIILENEAGKVDVGLVVKAVEGNEYEAVLYFGGLSREQESASEQKTVELHGSYTDFTLRLAGGFPLVFQFIHNRFTALDSDNTYRGHLEKVIHIKNSTSSN